MRYLVLAIVTICSPAVARVGSAEATVAAPVARSWYLVEWLKASDMATIATAAWAFHSSPAQDKVTMLVETPAGGRYLLTHVTDAPTGTMTASIVDDATGWSAVLTVQMGLTASSTAAWYRQFEPERLPMTHEVSVAANTSGGIRLGPLATAYRNEPTEYEALLKNDALTAARASVAKQIPQELLRDLPALEAAFTLENQYGYHMKGIVGFLRSVSAQGPPVDRTTVVADRVSPSDQRLSAVVGRFRLSANPAIR